MMAIRRLWIVILMSAVHASVGFVLPNVRRYARKSGFQSPFRPISAPWCVILDLKYAPHRSTPLHVVSCNTSETSQTNAFSGHEQDFNKTNYEDIVVDVLTEQECEQISALVKERANARFRGEYELGDSLRDQIGNLTFVTGYYGNESIAYMVELRDVPRSEGGGCAWTLVPRTKEESYVPPSGDSVLHLAHAALGLASSSTHLDPKKALQSLISVAEERLALTGALELSGRKAADAAFWFALAGVGAEGRPLLDGLTRIATEELKRFGHRSSCRPKDVWHILERIAAAGVSDMSELHSVAVDCLQHKEAPLHELEESKFGLHSTRPLMTLWRFSTRQRKQRAFLQSAAQHWGKQQLYQDGRDDTKSPKDDESATRTVEQELTVEYDWSNMFEDPTLPLVVDIGCGMGVSLLGLASLGQERENDSHDCLGGVSCLDVNWGECNFLGADLSQLAIGYAKGVAGRWNLETKRLAFSVDSAEHALDQICDSYPGPIQLVMIQFPTPFRLQQKNTECRGNSQLPSNAISGFMVTEGLLQMASRALQVKQGVQNEGTLLLQSNCEDVCVHMRNTAMEKASFDYISLPHTNKDIPHPSSKSRLPQRTMEWIAAGGERAQGSGWSPSPLLPRKGATETEISCLQSGTPIHRCLLKPR
uniref:tRNA (guanine(46)-N(7))-methyltransferase n=1 Tax=Attheya septentrionalis TaxID=420275 RepID=A0A6T7K0B4_9STRA|mmetsp:Transcript_7180/g.12883  ORF Transcript_7180/g.12883 Transcript_7180/m.12883 type:complete len:650 (+) Transcript_7180:142-2091(+)